MHATLFKSLALSAVLVAAGSRQLDAQPPADLDPQDVIAAIDSGVQYLKSEQKPTGRWDTYSMFDGGVTALCTLALLNSGVEPDDPTVAKALQTLRKIKPTQTYCIALKIMVLSTASPRRDLATIQKCVEQLEAMQFKGPGPASGGWSYKASTGSADPSNAQFAVLGLYEAQRAGAKVSPETWRLANGYWRRIQNEDGSWSYGKGRPSSGSMTCAGLSALVIIASATDQGDARVEEGRVRCCIPHKEDERIQRGLDWMGRNFSVARNPTTDEIGRDALYYYLYAMERVGRLTAQRFIGGHDWYREGTKHIVLKQDPLSKYWRSNKGHEKYPHIASPLALLFLSKGRRPVLMGKFDYGEGWNQHRHDAAHLTQVAEKAWRLDLTWQQLDPEGASVEDLLQTPVIYISGSKAAALSQHAKKLRDYVDRGGFLFAEACCSDAPKFRRSFEQLIAQMFPEPEYRLRQLRPAHPIWRMERTVSPQSAYAGKLWAVEYGCRTCVVFCQEDLSCYWELDRPAKQEYPKPILQRVNDAADIGLNVLAYATNRKPRGKEQVFVEDAIDPLGEGDQQRGVIRVCKLQHGGGCNDAPGALANLTRAAGQGELKLRIATESPLIGLADPALFHHTIAFIHGRHDFRLTEKERGQLRLFLERGGTLLGDSICASDAFTRGFRRELLAAMPGSRLVRVPPDDPIYTTQYGGFDVRTVMLRNPQPTERDEPIAAQLRRSRPLLEGIKIDDRWAVIFSPYDLSCALEKHEAAECRGYSREDAARIGLNVLIYALNY